MKSGYPIDLAEANPLGEVAVSMAIEEGLLRRRVAAVLAAAGLTIADAGKHPNVVVMGRALDKERLLDLRHAFEAFRPAPVVVVSPRTSAPGLRRALGAGAHGLVFDSQVDSALAPTVRAVAAGQLCVPCEMNGAADKPALSHREREVLKLAVSGRTNAEIAAALCLAESTIKSHLSSAFNRLGVRSRREAATLVLDPEQGLMPIVLGTDTATPGWANGNGDAHFGPQPSNGLPPDAV
ncbi:MAG TPA: response regulator transcription factor [Thermoleophilaceae bacterium]|jgi:DNA-binding NarL/FixJ family response regulator